MCRVERRQHRLESRTERGRSWRDALLYPYAYLLYILLSSLDIIITWTILRAGGRELNVIADWVIRNYDRVGVVVYKSRCCHRRSICETVGRRNPTVGRAGVLGGRVDGLSGSGRPGPLAIGNVHTEPRLS